MYCIIMVGVPGSGKSTIANTILKSKYNATIFSSDEYRKNLLHDENCQQDNNLIFKTLYADLDKSLARNENVIFDATNVSRKSRSEIIKIARKHKDCKVIAYIINIPIEECIKRNSLRSRKVPEEIIHKFISKFQCPQLEEGIDEIIFHKTTSAKQDAIKVINKMVGFNQKNYHHAYTLDVHTDNLMKFYQEGSTLWYAAKYHDVGKLFTQSFDSKGEAHYYSHANYSAYWLCCNIELIPESCSFVDIIFYINEHMHIRDLINSQNTLTSFLNMFGVIKLNNLISFMENDNSSCK